MNRIVVVSGPPCAGKTTHVDEHRSPEDLVIDLDRIAIALGAPADHLELDHPARHMALIVKASILKRLPTNVTTWIIDTNHRYPDVLLDPGPEECHRRATADGRPQQTHQVIDQWYSKHPPTRSW